MPLAETAPSVVEEQESFTPDESFSSGFEDVKEETPKTEPETEKVEEKSETQTEEKVETPKTEETKEASSKEETSSDVSEESLSALEAAEKQAREKFVKKPGTEEPTDNKTEEKTEEAPEPKPVEIDFSDVDADPGKYVSSIIDKIPNEQSRAQAKEVLESYPAIGQIAAMVARDLVSRQSVKMVDGPKVEIPEDMQSKFQSLDSIQEQLKVLEQDRAQQQFFNDIEKEVPGARAIQAQSKFHDWLDKQSTGIYMLAESPDPKDAVLVLKAFQEHEARLVAKQVDEKATQKKQKVDSSSRKILKSSSQTQMESSDDFAGGFNA